MYSYQALEITADYIRSERMAEAERERLLAQLGTRKWSIADMFTFVCILVGLVVFDLLAMNYGYDSRDGFRSR
jgi:hypothetical protein